MYFFRYNNVRLDQRDISGYEVHNIDAGQIPTPRVSKYNLARADGEKVTGVNYGGRKITIEGRIFAVDRNDMEAKLDDLKYYLSGTDKNLDIEVRGAIRRFKATLESFTTTINGYSCEYTAVFTCDAYGKDVNTTSLTLTSPMTSSPLIDVNTITGNGKARPTFDFTIAGVDPYWTSKYLDIKNTALNKTMRINRTWGWYDRVVIDGEAKSVSLYASTKTVVDECNSTSGWTSTHTLSLESSLMKQGTGCLKNVMAGAAILLSFIKLNHTAVDYSSNMGKVILPIFIPTPTAGAVSSIDFKIGSNTTFGTNYCYWRKTTQFDGSALATNAWNYLEIDLSTSPTSTTGSPVRGTIISTGVDINGTSAAMQLSGVLLDYMTIQKAGITATALDYAGVFPEYEPGLANINFTDEFTMRRITRSAYYTKRYL